MRAPRTHFLALSILLSSSSVAKVDGFLRGSEACIVSRPVVGGQPCPSVGLVCNPDQPVCTGAFDAHTSTCTDTYLPCTCRVTGGNNNKEWACQVLNFMCVKPDDRCTCDNPALVGPGKVCYKEGLSCKRNQPSCTGIFNTHTNACADAYLPCTCNTVSGINKTWTCPIASCVKPDERCTCDNPALVGPGKVCYKEGLSCKRNKPSCTGIFNTHTNTCTDAFLPCTCNKESGNNKTWTCPMATCVKPDDRCTCDNPALIGPGKVCYKEGLVCPDGKTVTCAGLYDAATKRCHNATIVPDCSCDNGTWSCAIPFCPKEDSRCT